MRCGRLESNHYDFAENFYNENYAPKSFSPNSNARKQHAFAERNVITKIVQRIELLLGQGKINNVNPRLKLKKLRRQ
jgi:fructose-1,6-bisphosphatase